MNRTYLFLLGLVTITLFATAQSGRRQPREVPLRQFASGRIVIQYVPTPYLTRNIKNVSGRLESNLREAESMLGTRLDGQLKVYLFRNWEDKGNFIDDIRLAHARPDASTFYCVLNEQWDGIAERMEFQILLQKGHGKAFYPQWE
jgi:hypothetical protein